ncbi:hypothetical protein [Nocardioides sp.]|uniref:hypothetical protein n=1 Tax=Nocardioides sp. TaxID=35761 RepID=UPI00198B805C|nr:hypothetical protein [Nocardioides sp.]MBC7275710.1 hypothetical protein [Nocardioides sp.]
MTIVVRTSLAASVHSARSSPAVCVPHLISTSLECRGLASGSMKWPISQPRRSAPSSYAFPVAVVN